MAKAKANPKGRPSVYSKEVAEKICYEVSTTSKGMRTICKDLNIPYGTVMAWLSDGHANYKEDFTKQYTRAKELQADYLAEEIIEIADDSSNDILGFDDFGNAIQNKEFVNRSRLRVDARKWVASKLKPKRYGNSVDVTSKGETIKNDNSSEIKDLAKAINELKTKNQ